MSLGSVCLNKKADMDVLKMLIWTYLGISRFLKLVLYKQYYESGTLEVSGWKENSNLIFTFLNSGKVFIIFAPFSRKRVPEIWCNIINTASGDTASYGHPRTFLNFPDLIFLLFLCLPWFCIKKGLFYIITPCSCFSYFSTTVQPER